MECHMMSLELLSAFHSPDRHVHTSVTHCDICVCVLECAMLAPFLVFGMLHLANVFCVWYMCDLEYGALVAPPVSHICERSIYTLLFGIWDAIFRILNVYGIWVDVFGIWDDEFCIWHKCDLECAVTAVSSCVAHLWTLNTPFLRLHLLQGRNLPHSLEIC